MCYFGDGPPYLRQVLALLAAVADDHLLQARSQNVDALLLHLCFDRRLEEENG